MNIHLLRGGTVNHQTLIGFGDFLIRYPIVDGNLSVEVEYPSLEYNLDAFDDPEDSSYYDILKNQFLRHLVNTYCMDFRTFRNLNDKDIVLLIMGDDTQLNEWKANYDESGLPNIYVHSDMWEGYSRPDKYERLDFEMGAYFLNDAYLDFLNGNLRSL